MRILFCNYEYPPLGGGGGVVTALLAQELARRHEVTVLTSSGPGLPAEEAVQGVRIVRAPVVLRTRQATATLASMGSFMFSGVRAGRRLLAQRHFDLINTHFVLPTGPVGSALAPRADVPNVLSLHGGDLYDPSKWTSPHRHWLLRAWVRRLVRRADRVVGQSRNTIANLRRFYVPEVKPVLVPLGIGRPPAGTARRGDYGFGEDDILLVTVGRLVARKAIDQLIAMLPALARDRARLLIMGDGPLEAELRKTAAEHGVAERVAFLGHVDESEKFRILRMCDLFVSTSQHEGFGLVFLEALACGLPVVCYDHGGQTDFLEHAVTGYLLPLNDRAGLEARCRALIADRALRGDLGRAGLARAENLFIDRCAERYEAVFDEVLADHRRQKQGTPAALAGNVR